MTESPRTVYTDADGKELDAAHIDHSDDMTTLKVGDKTYKKDETDGKYYLQKEDGTADKLIQSLFHKRLSTQWRQMP